MITLFDCIDKRPSKDHKNPKLETGRVHFETASWRINDGMARKAIEQVMSLDDPDAKPPTSFFGKINLFVEQKLGTPAVYKSPDTSPDSKVVLENINVI